MDPARIIELGEEVGCSLTDEQARLILAHTEAVLEMNRSLNLTAVREIEGALRLHIQDSLAVAGDVATLPHGALLDLGTGGGFPGIPLAIVSGRPTVLLDSVKKKVAFLADLVSSLGLDYISAAPERAEEYALHHMGGFAVVVARAVAPLPSLVELAAPLLRKGGGLVAMKGMPAPVEVDEGIRVGNIAGMSFGSARSYELPGGEQRVAYTFIRAGKPKVALPRRVGMAQKSPLG